MAILAGIAALFVGWLTAKTIEGRPSIAELRTGTDDAFALGGLEPRENLVGGGALRWTRPTAEFRFDDIGPGAVDITLTARDHRTEVTVTANGASIGTLAPGQRELRTRTTLQGRGVTIALQTEGFTTASGRALGTQFESLAVAPVEVSVAPRRFLFVLAVVFALGLIVQLALGRSPLFALLAPLLLAAMTVPSGLWRSGWTVECGVLTTLSALGAAAVASAGSGSGRAKGALQCATMLGLAVHFVLPPSPLIVQSDAQLHGNKLGEVARGNLFPISRTDHKTPFDFPYGFSFYALLSPLASSAVENVSVARHGAAFFTGLSILALGLVVGRVSSAWSAGALVFWTFAPANIRTMAYGNLNNVFAQATFVLFLTGATRLPGPSFLKWALAMMMAVSATAHLSSFIVVAIFCAFTLLLPSDRRQPAARPLFMGAGLAAIYFLTFAPMIVRQAPRLLAERGGSAGAFDPWRLPQTIGSLGAGWPLIGAALLAVAVRRTRTLLPLPRGLSWTIIFLAGLALVSPIEVRYMLAAIPLLAIVGAATLQPRGDIAPGDTEISPALRAGTGALLVASVLQGAIVLREYVPLWARQAGLLH